MQQPRRFVHRISCVHSLSPEELGALDDLYAPPLILAPHTDLIVEGEEVNRGYIFEEGWGGRYRLLNDGRRQILNFVVPGDYVGASANVIRAADHSVCALTRCRVYPFPVSALSEIQQRFSRLKSAFDWSVRRDLAILHEHIVDLGRRTARERVAHLILELLHRLRLVGLCDGRKFELPLTQEMLADALGLSIVHVNRTLRRLSKDRLIDYRPGTIDVIAVDALTDIAEFDEDYLHQPRMAPAPPHALQRIEPAGQQ